MPSTDRSWIDNEALIEAFARRVDVATVAMIGSAAETTYIDLPTVNLTLLTTIFGAVRAVFERNLSLSEARAVQDQLVLMCMAYLEAAKVATSHILSTGLSTPDPEARAG